MFVSVLFSHEGYLKSKYIGIVYTRKIYLERKNSILSVTGKNIPKKTFTLNVIFLYIRLVSKTINL